MKNLLMCSFYDKKSERFDTPFFTQGELMARRHFIMSIQKEGSLMQSFKDDMELHKLGEFCYNTGEIMVNETSIPELILKGKDVKIEK